MKVGCLSCTHCEIRTLVDPNSGEKICSECGCIVPYGLHSCTQCTNSQLREILSLLYEENIIDPCPYCKQGVLSYHI
jgi:ribosomal protein L40E